MIRSNMVPPPMNVPVKPPAAVAAVPDTPLYEAGKTVYPQSVKGRFRTVKWVLMAVFLGIWGTFIISGVDNVLKPYLISRGGNLPLVVVLLGVFGGILAFGFMGLFLGPTLLAVAYSLLMDWSATQAQVRREDKPL